MTQQEEDKLREGFTKQFTSEDYFKRAFVEAPTKAVVDYWISKIKERDLKLVEEIEATYADIYNSDSKSIVVNGEKMFDTFGQGQLNSLVQVLNLINKENE